MRDTLVPRGTDGSEALPWFPPQAGSSLSSAHTDASRPQARAALRPQPGLDFPRNRSRTPADRMRQQLRELGLVHEQATERQHPCDLGDAKVSTSDVKQGPEVDGEVERPVRKRKRTHISNTHLGVDSVRIQCSPCRRDRQGINVDTNEPAWLTQSCERRQCDTMPTPDLEHPRCCRQPEAAQEDWHFEPSLPPVATPVIREWPILGHLAQRRYPSGWNHR